MSDYTIERIADLLAKLVTETREAKEALFAIEATLKSGALQNLPEATQSPASGKGAEGAVSGEGGPESPPRPESGAGMGSQEDCDACHDFKGLYRVRKGETSRLLCARCFNVGKLME